METRRLTILAQAPFNPVDFAKCLAGIALLCPRSGILTNFIEIINYDCVF